MSLIVGNSVRIHRRNFQIYATEVFKIKNSLAPEIKEPHYNLSSETSCIEIKNVKSDNYGIQSVRHLEPKIWDTVPHGIREPNSLNESKNLGNRILVLVDFAKTTLLKWVLFDFVYIEHII